MLADSPFDWSKIEVENTVTSFSSSHLMTSSKFSKRNKILSAVLPLFSLWKVFRLAVFSFFSNGKSEKFKFAYFFHFDSVDFLRLYEDRLERFMALIWPLHRFLDKKAK